MQNKSCFKSWRPSLWSKIKTFLSLLIIRHTLSIITRCAGKHSAIIHHHKVLIPIAGKKKKEEEKEKSPRHTCEGLSSHIGRQDVTCQGKTDSAMLWEAPEGPKTTGPCVFEWICKVIRKHVQAGGWDVPSPAATRSLDLPPDGDQTHILLSEKQINGAEARHHPHAMFTKAPVATL